jgi:di/tricarboxylate transporter
VAEEEDVPDKLVQAVVAPRSDLVGRTLSQVDFRRRYGALVVGLWRKDGLLQEELSKTRLREGDVLVLQGDDEAFARVGEDRAFLMMVPFQGETRRRGKMLIAAGVMLFTVLAASLSWLTLDMAAVTGALLMVLLRCITSRQGYRAIDARIYVFIAGAIPLGDAMEKTGTSKLLAGWLQAAIGGWSPLAILLAIYAIVAVLTQFMSDSATTALIAPIAAAFAQGLGQPPEAFVVTVAMASVVAFMTPIGHHGNLLIYGPGRYQFNDFVRVGTPLTIICGVVVCVIALLLWHA